MFDRWSALPRWLSVAAALATTACGGGPTAVVGGTLSGLGSGLSLVVQDNQTDSLALTSNGAFAFSRGLDSRSAYDVTVQTQPVGQTCTTANASGTIDGSGNAVDSVIVTCTTTSSLAGSVTGLLPGATLTLNNNGQTPLAVTTNGAFAFPGILAPGDVYMVQVSVQPTGQYCTVTDSSGSIVAGTQSLVSVSCS